MTSKVLINGLNARNGGGLTYLKNILPEFSNYDVEMWLLVNRDTQCYFGGVLPENANLIICRFSERNLLVRTLFEIFILPFFLKLKRITHYFAPGGLMLTYSTRSCRSVTALRNMLPFDFDKANGNHIKFKSRIKLIFFKYLSLISYKMSDGVIFISDYSRKRVCQTMPSILSKSRLIYHGLNDSFKSWNADNKKDPPSNLKYSRYALYISRVEPYKCQLEIAKAWNEDIFKEIGSCPLVFAGPGQGCYYEDFIKYVEKNPHSLAYLGEVDHETLPKLYGSSELLIFGSVCECCPNILLEKMASLKPIFCSNHQPMPEFGKDSVFYFDPLSEKSLLGAVLEYNRARLDGGQNETQRKLIIESFDWQSTARKTIEFITESESSDRNR